MSDNIETLAELEALAEAVAAFDGNGFEAAADELTAEAERLGLYGDSPLQPKG